MKKQMKIAAAIVSAALLVSAAALPASAAKLRGDFDGNGKLDSSDATYLLRNVLVGAQDYPISQSGDVDGDGKVTSSDAIYLLRNVLLGSSLYPLAPEKSSGGGAIELPEIRF